MMIKNSITQYKEWPKGLETSYHDLIVRASKNEITTKLGFEPKYVRDNFNKKSKYNWLCNLNNGEYFFTIYDMEYDEPFTDDTIIEYHIGFDDNYNEFKQEFPTKIEALKMITALEERDLEVDHSKQWKEYQPFYHEIEEIVNRDLFIL